MTFRSKTDWSLILKGCRREQNFSQRELAEKSGVFERTVQQYENAKIISEIDCGIIIDKDKTDIDNVISFIKKVINDKKFNKRLLDSYNKINIQNTNQLMINIIQNDQKK